MQEQDSQFTATYLQHAESIRKFIYFKINDHAASEDLLQETYLRYWQQLSQEPAKISDSKNWLYTVARNLVFDHYRQKYKTPLSLDNIDPREFSLAPLQEKEMEDKINKKRAQEYLSGLEKKYRDILIYRYLKHLSIEEICRLTGKSPNYISVIIYQGIKILKESLSSTNSKGPANSFT